MIALVSKGARRVDILAPPPPPRQDGARSRVLSPRESNCAPAPHCRRPHATRMAAHGFVSNESMLQAENDDLRSKMHNVINAARGTQDFLRRLWSHHEAALMQIQQLKAELLQARSQREGAWSTSGGEEGRLPVEEDEAGASGKWNLLAWTRGAGFHRVVTAALHKRMADRGLGNDSDAALRFIRGLKGQGEIDSLLRTEEVMGGLSDLLWSATVTLQRAGAAKRSRASSLGRSSSRTRASTPSSAVSRASSAHPTRTCARQWRTSIPSAPTPTKSS